MGNVWVEIRMIISHISRVRHVQNPYQYISRVRHMIAIYTVLKC